jgi:ectoine hydroxylase-related dioxygenase (phytanoyl-CoA dioxygenase family)
MHLVTVVHSQAWHTDYPPGMSGAEAAPIVCLVALQDCSLLVCPGSHHALQALYTHTQLSGTGEVGGGVVEEIMSQLRPKRLQLKAGDIVLLHGLTLHAGDAGQAGVRAARMHFYIVPRTATPASSMETGSGSITLASSGSDSEGGSDQEDPAADNATHTLHVWSEALQAAFKKQYGTWE